MSISKTLKNIYGPWAVVTGASSGIGAEFARQLAAAGLSVAIVARRVERLEELSRSITATHPSVQIKVIVADLTTNAGIRDVIEGTQSLDVGFFVNNAGVESIGAFLTLDMDSHQRLIDLNVSACTKLSHAFGRRLVEHTRADSDAVKRGGVLMVSSILNQPSPYFAVYGASKAFMSAISLAMRTELEPERVDVMSLEPGVVMTELADRVKQVIDVDAVGAQVMEVKQCVEEALQAFEKRKARFTPGRMNRIMRFLMGFLPENLLLSLNASKLPSIMAPELIEYK